AAAAPSSSSSSSKSPDEKKKAFSPEVGSLVDSAVAPPPGFEDLPDDTHLCLGQLAQLLTAAANKEVPPTPQAPTLEPKIPENVHPSPSPAVPAARRPDWIPDTPASPLYLHRDMNFGQTPNPLVQFLQMQAAAGAAGQIPPTVAASRGSYGTAARPPMATPFMPMGGPPPQAAAAAVGLDGDLAGLAAWGASWPSSVPSGLSKRQSTSQPPIPIQEETVDEEGEVCAPPSSHQQQRQPYHLVSYYYPLLAAPFDDPPGFSSSSSSTAIAGPYSSGLPLPPPPSAAVYVFFYASTLDGVVPLVDYSWSSAPLSWIPLLEVESYSCD
ncbi:hypothetical protein FOZ63_010058, partial [Perkinsus olseni]